MVIRLSKKFVFQPTKNVFCLRKPLLFDVIVYPIGAIPRLLGDTTVSPETTASLLAFLSFLHCPGDEAGWLMSILNVHQQVNNLGLLDKVP